MAGLKLAAAAGFLLSGLVTLSNQGGSSSSNYNNHHGFAAATSLEQQQQQDDRSSGTEMRHRRLLEVDGNTPTYMKPLMKDLQEREKLFAETPPEEVKYWFEYTGPLQVRRNTCTALHICLHGIGMIGHYKRKNVCMCKR